MGAKTKVSTGFLSDPVHRAKRIIVVIPWLIKGEKLVA